MKVLLLSIATLSAATAIGATAMARDAAPAAAPTAVPAPTAAPVSKKDPNERVCKTSPVIGSRVPSRICMTRAEWEERARTDRADLEAAQRSGLATCGTRPCS